MNKTFIAIIILGLIILAVFLFLGMSNKAEAPATNQSEVSTGNNSTVPNTTTDSVAPVVGTYVPPAGTGALTGETKTFTVTGKNFSFSPAFISVKKGDRVQIVFKNENGSHDLKIDEFSAGTQIIQSGQQTTIEFIADKTGSFQYYCSVDSHRALGMQGTLKVE